MKFNNGAVVECINYSVCSRTAGLPLSNFDHRAIIFKFRLLVAAI